MNNWIRILIGIVVLATEPDTSCSSCRHWESAQWGQSPRSWLLTNLLGDGLTRALGAGLWLAVILAYVVGVIGMFTHAAWWQPTLVTASVASSGRIDLVLEQPAHIASHFGADLRSGRDYGCAILPLAARIERSSQVYCGGRGAVGGRAGYGRQPA